MAKHTTNGKSRPGIKLPLWAVILLAIIGGILFIGGAVWLYQSVSGLASDWEVTSPEFGDVSEPSAPDGSAPDNPDQISSGGEDSSLPVEALKPWSGRDRVSILLLGIDQRCEETGPTRTDTMMVLTMDPIGLSAAVLSLPRDLWVEIPGFGVDRINQAHYMGQIYEYPGGGPGLAVDTVEATLGVSINYYVTINFDAFVEVVDQIGGIDVTVAETIDDRDYPDRCYGYDPFYIEAGQQHLDGQAALKYARTRSTFGGDVDRAARQQQVMLAVRKKVLQLDMVPQLIGQAPMMWQTFQDNVRTNLTLNEVIQLGLLAQEIPAGSIRTEVINYDYVYNETTPDGQQVLVPIRENVRRLRDELFAPPAIPTPIIENLPEMVLTEEARVAVYNGTGTFGLAAATQEYLQNYNINVVEIGNADSSTYRTTQIIDYGSHNNTTLYLTQLMGIPPLNISNGTKPGGDYDVLIIIGNDWQVPDS